jgi:hypothetical protein
MKSHIKAHKYEIKQDGVMCTRIYLTNQAVLGYDPDTRERLLFEGSSEFIREGEQAKLGVLENGVYLREFNVEENLLEDVLEGLISTSSIGFGEACKKLIDLAEERK